MLDTNMVSYIVKRQSPAASSRLLSLGDDEVAILSAITVGEIRYGLAKKPEATALKTLMDGFLASVLVLSWGNVEAEAYGRVRARLEKSGLSLGNLDMMIAAHAVVTGSTLVTNDKAFAQVDELSEVVNWATDL